MDEIRKVKLGKFRLLNERYGDCGGHDRSECDRKMGGGSPGGSWSPSHTDLQLTVSVHLDRVSGDPGRCEHMKMGFGTDRQGWEGMHWGEAEGVLTQFYESRK